MKLTWVFSVQVLNVCWISIVLVGIVLAIFALFLGPFLLFSPLGVLLGFAFSGAII